MKVGGWGAWGWLIAAGCLGSAISLQVQQLSPKRSGLLDECSWRRRCLSLLPWPGPQHSPPCWPPNVSLLSKNSTPILLPLPALHSKSSLSQTLDIAPIFFILKWHVLCICVNPDLSFFLPSPLAPVFVLYMCLSIYVLQMRSSRPFFPP